MAAGIVPGRRGDVPGMSGSSDGGDAGACSAPSASSLSTSSGLKTTVFWGLAIFLGFVTVVVGLRRSAEPCQAIIQP